MLLSIQYPHITAFIETVGYGLVPLYSAERGKFLLVIKASKEVILTARLNRRFDIYVLDDPVGPHSHLCFVTAFFDDHDEPLRIVTPQFEGDAMSTELRKLLSQDEFDVYFFDENNREMMGVSVHNPSADRFKALIADISFPTFDQRTVGEIVRRSELRFAIRDAQDDRDAFVLAFKSSLYPDDLIFVDARSGAPHFGGEHSHSTNTIERENPGPHQERDIALLLARVFPHAEIYLNPVRTDNNKEICDLLVVHEGMILFIQAKDSPNTEVSLRRSVERKRLSTKGHVEKAARQVLGAARYASASNTMNMIAAGKQVAINIEGRQYYGLVVVQELFDDDAASGAAVVEIARTNFPCLLVDYSGMHLLAQNLRSPAAFVNALSQLSAAAVEDGHYSRPVWLGPPPVEQ